MNVLLSLLLIVFFIHLNPSYVLAASSNEPSGIVETQLYMSDESCQDYQQQDKEMNDLYKSLKRSYKKDRGFSKRLKKAQKRWLKFRDAHVYMMYPKTTNNPRAASSRTMCRCILLASMTEIRNNQLRAMLMPEEGDVCALPAPAMPNIESP